MTLEGKKKKLKRTNFEHLGKILSLNEKQIESVFKRIVKNKTYAIDWIDNSFLSSEYKKKYKILLEQKYLALMGVD